MEDQPQASTDTPIPESPDPIAAVPTEATEATETATETATENTAAPKGGKDQFVGLIIDGTVTHIAKFGAFVRIEGGEEGLVHISEVANEYVTDITKFFVVGDVIKIKVLGRNEKGKLEFSAKRAIEKEQTHALFIHTKSKNTQFEEIVTSFMKKSDEKQIDVRRNLKHKQGVVKKRR